MGSSSSNTQQPPKPTPLPQTSASTSADVDDSNGKLSKPDKKKYKISISGVNGKTTNGKHTAIPSGSLKPRTPSQSYDYSNSQNNPFLRREREILKIIKKANEEQEHWMKILD